MPRRSNLFQDVVAIVHRRLSPDASITESAELRHRLTGRKREVDVVVQGTVAGHPVQVSIEATKGGRRATVEWVERMVAKHQHLSTNRLILVAERGFTRQARELALKENVVPVEPEELSDDDLASLVAGLVTTLWPKLLSLSIETVQLVVQKGDEGELATIADPAPDFRLVFEGMRPAGSLMDGVRGIVSTVVERDYEELVRDVAEDQDGRFTLKAAPLLAQEGDSTTPVGLRLDRDDGQSEFHPITELTITGTRHIRVRSMSIVDKRIAGIKARYGEYDVDDQHHSLVITSTEEGDEAVLRVRSANDASPTDYKLMVRRGDEPPACQK